MKNTNSIGMFMLIELKVLIAFVRKDIIIILILALHDPTMGRLSSGIFFNFFFQYL